MSEAEFILKWDDQNIGGEYWKQNAERLFWARSYMMPNNQLKEMSRDLLSIPGMQNSWQSSACLAKQTTRYEIVKS